MFVNMVTSLNIKPNIIATKMKIGSPFSNMFI